MSKPTLSTKYLADVARAEWLLYCSVRFGDLALALAPNVLGADAANLKFVLSPGVSLMASEYPIERLIEVHLGTKESWSIDISTGGGEFLVAL